MALSFKELLQEGFQLTLDEEVLVGFGVVAGLVLLARRHEPNLLVQSGQLLKARVNKLSTTGGC